jgi:hypothetical protein
MIAQCHSPVLTPNYTLRVWRREIRLDDGGLGFFRGADSMWVLRRGE